MQYVAAFVRKMPWTVVLARNIWRLGQAKFSAGVVGVVFDDQDRVLLVEHVFHPYVPWGLPGGWVDRRESPADAIQRELKEELRLDAQVISILLIDLYEGNHLDFAYLCRVDGQVGQLSRELLNYGWYDPNDLPRLPKFHYQAIQYALEQRKLVVT
jgi:ADP-ribose pyrophosphatase YjhB (NUDIX family)